MKRHWYKYFVITLITINIVTYGLYLFLPEIPTDCNSCSPDGWCTMRACPTIADVAGQLFSLLHIISIPLFILLTLMKLAFLFRAKHKSFEAKN